MKLLRPALLLLLLAPVAGLADAPQYRQWTVAYKRVGADSLRLNVERLADDEVRAAVFFLHGGGLIARPADGAMPELEPVERRKYVDAGYAFVTVEYRVAPETKLPEIVADVEDAWAWLRANGERFRIDPNRIAVVGHSAGGYLTLLAGARLRPRPRALVDFHGLSDISGAWLTEFEPPERDPTTVDDIKEYIDWSPIPEAEATAALTAGRRFTYVLYCWQNGIWPQVVSGHDPRAEPEWFHKYEPIRNVTADYPPTLLLHGEADSIVPVEQSRRMAAELARHGVEYELLTFPGFGHHFEATWAHWSTPAVQDAYERVLAFLAGHLR